MRKENSGYLKRFLPALFIFLLTIVFFHSVVFEGKTFYAFDTLPDYLPWSSYVPKDFQAHNTLITDPVNIFYPYFHFVKKCFEAKSICFWNPYTFGGLPKPPPGNPAVFLCYLLFPQSAAHDLILWLHLLGTGLFMFLYLRQIDMKPLPALTGAVAWMFNGYVMVWFEFENVSLLAPTLPAALYFLERWLRRRTNLDTLCIAGSIAWLISVNTAQFAIYQCIFLCIYFVWKYLTLRRKKSEDSQSPIIRIGKKELAHIAMAMALILCISSNFIFRHVSLLNEDPQRRPAVSLSELYHQTGALPGKYLITLIFPDFFGTPAGNERICFTPKIRNAQPYNNYNEMCIYSGILPLFLILASLFYMRKKPYVLFYFFTALISLGMAMEGFLYYPLYKFVPGLNLSTPLRILYFFGFALCVCAAGGADILMEIRDKKKKLMILTSWIIFSAMAGGIYLTAQTEPGVKWAADGILYWTEWGKLHTMLQDHFAPLSPILLNALSLILMSFLLLTIVLFSSRKNLKNVLLFLAILTLAYDLISFGLFYNTASHRNLEFPRTDAIRFLQKDRSPYRVVTAGNFMHNSFTAFDIQDAGGYSSFYGKRYGEFMHLSQREPDKPVPEKLSRWMYFKRFGSPLLDLVNIKYLLLPRDMPVVFPKLRLVYDGEIRIYENKAVFPRAFFVPRYEFCEDQEFARKLLASFAASDFREKVILESLPPEEFRKNNISENEANSEVSIISYEFDRIELEVSADQNGFLIVSDNYHPDWNATADGEEIGILRANYIMRAVPVKKGTHRIVLTFSPGLLISGTIITLAGWGVLGVLLAISGISFLRRKL